MSAEENKRLVRRFVAAADKLDFEDVAGEITAAVAS